MKTCDLIKASLWNEIAIAIADAVSEAEPATEGLGNYLSLYVSDLSLHISEIEYHPEDGLAHSERCFLDHTPTKIFMENPVLA